MSGLSISRGNMYPWLSHMWSPIVGCPHQCTYCYVRNRWRDLPATVTLKPDPWPKLGSGRVIFVEHCGDLFANDVPDEWIRQVLGWCRLFPNEYVFQTKNPVRVPIFQAERLMPERYMIGTTIETNRDEIIARVSRAPAPIYRSAGMAEIHGPKFLTIEPVMDFDVGFLAALVEEARPGFVNLGADSKHHGLTEPSRGKVLELIEELRDRGIEVRQKTNLERLLA